MAPRRKTGRAAAEAAYANLLKENTALVGDVGEAWDSLVAKLGEAVAARERYEDARAAAVKSAAVTNDQLDQMGYKKTPKLPVLPDRPGAQPAPPAGHQRGARGASGQGASSESHSNGATAGPTMASVGAANPGEQA